MVLAADVDNYVLPIYLHVKLNPYLNHGISYVSILRPVKDRKDYLMVAPDGALRGISKSIAYELGLNVENLNTTNIFDFCGDYANISRVFNEKALLSIWRSEDFNEEDIEFQDNYNDNDKIER